MEGPLLRDPTESPDDEILARALGRANAAWAAFCAGLAAEHPDARLEWRYYADGKAWLGKLVRGKQTVCWVSIWDRAFKTTFYFTARTGQGIGRLPIAPALKAGYRAQPARGALRPLTVEVRRKQDVADVLTLVAYKRGAR